MTYTPRIDRYETQPYRRAGHSGLKLPLVSLGLWQNFGDGASFERCRAIIRAAFDLGVTHFDLANNYGPPAGAAEQVFGRILSQDLRGHRDELVIATKAGYHMWAGPYGEWGSRKHLLSSLDQSLRRLGLDYVDVFYSHRLDPDTPLDETALALHQAVTSGKALYAGISSYSAARTREIHAILAGLGTPVLVHQPSYSMFNRWVEAELLGVLGELGMGCVAFSPLAQGLLTERYLAGVAPGSRAAQGGPFRKEFLAPGILRRVEALAGIARDRGQSLAQMAVSWALRDPRVTSVIVGASGPEQLRENIAATANTAFSSGELARIDEYAVDLGINLWQKSSTA